ncbi:MAG TPA: efflux RND transporter permease subunit [Gemmatimonadaceae bacterium]|nr:efflux RND transporter permease subunit [Gemmatimonadaceae bacterium]
MSLPRRSIRRPIAVAMLFLAVVALGLISFTRLPIDLLPGISYPRLVVYTSIPEVGPAEVERLVTTVIEQQVARVPGHERTESVSRDGVSLVTLRFAWGTDMDFAALNVRERLDQVRDRLPQSASRPVVLRTDPTADPIMSVVVAGRSDLWRLKELAESVIKRRFEQVDGVAQATVTGGLEREIRVDVDPQLLESYQVTIEQVANALAAANQSSPGGQVRRGPFQYSLRTLGEFQSVQQIGDVVVAERRSGQGSDQGPGQPPPAGQTGTARNLILLSDIARIEDSFRDRESIARYNGDEAVGLLLFKEAGSNTVRVAERVDEVIEQLRRQYPDVTIEVATSQAGFISDAIDNVVSQVLVGGALAFLVLFLFLRDIRYPLAIALAMPISIIATFALFDAAGVSLNIMTLGGLALGVGLLMDNSVVVIENIFRRREMGDDATEAAAVGAEEVQRAIIAATLTTIAVFGPIIYVQGVAGKLFGALSYAVAFSLAASILVALTLLPALASRWTTDHHELPPSLARRTFRRGWSTVAAGTNRALRPLLDGTDRLFEALVRWYERTVVRALDNRGRVVAIAAVLMLGTLALASTLKRSVLPDVEQGEFTVRITLARGTPIDVTSESALRLENALNQDVDVAATFTRVGRQEAVLGGDERESGLNTALIDVRLRQGARTAEVLDRLRPLVAQLPPGTVAIETGQATALGKLLGGGEADLAIRIHSEELDEGIVYARQVEQRLARVGSLENVRLGTEMGHPEIRVHIDRDRAASFGITPLQVANQIQDYMLGRSATEYVAFDKKVPVWVRLPEEDRRSLATLDLLRIGGVPLRELVRVEETTGPAEIRRIDQSRIVTVHADVARGSVDAAIGDIREALRELTVPRGMRVDIGGENEEMRRGFLAMAFAFGLALLLVYMILAAEFESLLHPFTILLSVPLGTIGAIVALWIAGAGLNTVSLIGIVVLAGIVDNDAVIKVDFINQMRRKGMALRDAIVAAGRARIRPIVINSITTMLGVLPMALALGPGGELQAPLAIAIFGGLFTSTILTLIVIPVAYDLVEELRERVRGVVRAPGVTHEPLPQAGD